MMQAVIGGKEVERQRPEEGMQNGQKYKYQRVASDASQVEDQAEESDPELELEIERDTFQRKHSNLEAHLKSFRKSSRVRLITMVSGVVGVLLFLYWAVM
jgi:hypothetical protein